MSEDGQHPNYVGTRTDGTRVDRPLSPHLQVYDMLQMTSALSIMSRATGIAWSIGLVFLVWWVTALASGAPAFATVQWFLGSPLGWIVLTGLIVVTWYHTLAGIRHLAWDAGHGFDLPTAYRSGRIVLVGTGALSVLTLIILIAAWI